jgi:hypothetical protein
MPAFVLLSGKEGGVLEIPNLINAFFFPKVRHAAAFFGGKEKKWAATYSPGCNSSTIGAAGLNFSVRDGKRWGPCAGPPKVFGDGCRVSDAGC